MSEHGQDRATLRKKLVQYFNETDLRTVAFDLHLDYEMLSGRNKGEKAIELIAYFERHDRLAELIERCKEYHPDAFGEPLDKPQPYSKSMSSANPFFVGGRINNPDFFYGRRRLLREIRSELRKRASVSLVGDSQMGKSSLLYFLQATRQEWLPGVNVIYIDLQRVLDEADFCEEVLSRLGQEGDTLRQLKRSLTQTEVVLLLDEMERLAEPDFNPRLHDLLRALAQEPHFAMCLATRRPLIEVFPARTPGGVSPFHNIFVDKIIGPFSEEEARGFLKSRLATTSINFSQSDIDRLLIESNRHPGKLQQLAKDLYFKHGQA